MPNGSAPLIAVTGATGAVGGMVARALSEAGVSQRLLVRDTARAPRLPGATTARMSYGGDDDAAAALDGVSTLFLVSAAESADRRAQHLAVVDAAARAGVRHVVYTSFLGAAPDAVFTLARDHAATEERLRDSGMRWTVLRDSLYVDFVENLVGEDGAIRGPAGDGRVSLVARADVARSATAILLDPDPHLDRRYDLTGPEALTMAEVAETVGEVTGRSVRFVDETREEAFASRAGYGAPDWQVEAWVSTYEAIAAGQMAEVSGDVERLSGRAPVGLRAFLSSGR